MVTPSPPLIDTAPPLQELRARYPSVDIEVDGGLGPLTIGRALEGEGERVPRDTGAKGGGLGEYEGWGRWGEGVKNHNTDGEGVEGGGVAVNLQATTSGPATFQFHRSSAVHLKVFCARCQPEAPCAQQRACVSFAVTT